MDAKAFKKNRQNCCIVISVTKITTAEQFCHNILQSTIKRAKALVGIIMALGSEGTARNPTQLSLSPFFQYHYSIIAKVMKEFGEQLNASDNEELKSNLRQTFFDKYSVQNIVKSGFDHALICPRFMVS